MVDGSPKVSYTNAITKHNVMNRVDYIRHGLSVKQMELIYNLIVQEMARKNKAQEPEDNELNYAAELFRLAAKPKG